jgi:hypothetical protein
MEEKKPKLSTTASVVLVVLAGIADLLSLIPAVGILVGPVFWLCAGAYFWIAGLGFVNGRRLVTGGISTVAEIIPGIQAIPTILVGVIAIIAMEKIQEKTGINVTSVAGGKNPLVSSGSRMPNPIKPANQAGIRAPQGGLAKNSISNTQF